MRRSDNDAVLREGARIMTICNACRYCEGYCAVFPAMERRPGFSEADLNYLANLCHNCAECYYACQYAPPHEFAVNVPKTLATIRMRSYSAPVVWIAAVCVIGFLMTGHGPVLLGNFYGVVSHRAMVAIFGVAFAFALVTMGIRISRFWRESGAGLAHPAAWAKALRDALTLKYLDPTYPPSSKARRWFHHFTFYGFMLCFAATSVAALYHYVLGLRAPYAFLSLPVILGTVGGAGLLIGPTGLYALGRRSDPATTSMDVRFLAMLFLTSLTGLLLLAFRESAAMGPLLGIHLGMVLALFITMPYGKFVHGLYRLAALARYALEGASSAARQDL